MSRLLPKTLLRGWRETFDCNGSGGGEVCCQQPFHSVRAINCTRGRYWWIFQIRVTTKSPALLELGAKRCPLTTNMLEGLEQGAPDLVSALHHLLDQSAR